MGNRFGSSGSNNLLQDSSLFLLQGYKWGVGLDPVCPSSQLRYPVIVDATEEDCSTFAVI